MHLETWLQTPLANAIGWALFHSLWEGAIVAIVLAATLAITRSARARYIAACLAMCAILLCFGVTLLRLTPRHLAESAAKNPIVLPWNNDVVLADFPDAPMRRIADLLPWLVPFWMAGVVGFYLRHLIGWAMTRRLRRRGVCAAPDFWQERLSVLCRRLQLSRPVALLESCLATVPVVMGHLRPVVLMPVGLLTGLPAAQIESILLHELAHIRRYDYLVNMLQASVESLLFYHPVVWWISGVIRTEREHCCDDLAVALSGDVRQYAVALAALEQCRWGASETALAATGGNLVNRIRRLLIPAQGPSSGLTPFVSAGILMIAAAVGLTAWQEKAPAPERTFVAQTRVAQSEPSPKAEPEVSPYTRWLEEDVAYIIRPEERDAFLRLETDAERAEFIKQFWLSRDPTPGTPENEFKDEHYRRIAYANLHFPTATAKAGWKTDRGRIYIVYGPPDEIDDHSTGDAAAATPYIDWTYRYLDGVGTNVKMEFVDPAGTHDFHMTSDPNEKTGVYVPGAAPAK
jgi:GWxTD domain-containing protein